MPAPTGTVTFLFTDIEGSTRRWEAFPAAMAAAVARHDALVRQAIEEHGGHVFKTLGDAFCAAFAAPGSAAAAVVAAQRAVAAEDWSAVEGLRVRAALHRGEAEERDGDYFGPVLNRTARLLGACHGGQSVASLAVREALGEGLPDGLALRDLGTHRLRDLGRPEQVFQLCAQGLPDDFPPLASLEHGLHNLPIEVASFVGRRDELRAVGDRLASSRVVTLTGIGGVGKTRLALQAAAAALDDCPHGVWLVELAPVRDEAWLAQAVAAALGVREEAGRAVEEALLAHLATQRLLIVLDNCEHVVAGAARLADTIVRRCPGVRVLATSREALGIAGEHVYAVPPLGLPPHGASAGEAARSDVVRLFVERAAAVRPGFALDEDNAEAVAELCRRLDGIPLAVELAAARVRIMTPQQILARIDQRFQLLTGGSRTADPRQQTLRATIAWSYDLLDPDEQAVLRRLSVFRGGAALSAAAAACADVEADEWLVLDRITRLVDKSLVVAAAPGDGDAADGDEPRYALLETVREFAHHALDDAGELPGARARHAAHFAARATELGRAFWDGRQTEAVAGLDREHDNLRAALDHATAADGALAVALCAALYPYWEVRGLLAEGAKRAADALAAAPPDAPAATRGWARYGLAVLTMRAGDPEAASDAIAMAIEDLAAAGDPGELRHAYTLQGSIALARGDLRAAREHYERALETVQRQGDRSDRTALMAIHNNLGLVALSLGDVAAARASLAAALASATTGSDFARAVLEFNLALAMLAAGDLAAAAEGLAASLAKRRALDNRWGISLCVEAAGWLAAARGDASRAARLMAAAEALRGELDMTLEPLQRRFRDEALAAAAATLSPDDRVAAEAAGVALGWEAAVAEAEAVLGDAREP